MLTALLLASAVSIAPAERTVVIVPFGKVNPAFVTAVEQAVAATADVKTRVDPQREMPKEAWYAPRKRWRAEKILDAIDADPPEGAWKVVAVTEKEISTTKGKYEDWGIVGLGNLDDRSCITSTYIFRKHSRTQDVLVRRVRDSAIHELGHTLGLDHCETEACVMRDAKGKAITSTDASSGKYCDRCRALLPENVAK